MATNEVKVPDIGDYSKVPVIEVLVKPGDTVAKDQGLVTLESDKATMEVPSTVAGVVKEVKVKVGDEISEGTVVAVIDAKAARSRRRRAPARAARQVRLAREEATAAPPSPQPSPAAKAAESAGAKSCVVIRTQSRHRMPGLRARLRSRRLHGGIPRRRSRPEHRAHRTLRDARRRVSQRRLHSVESAAARRAADRRGIAFRRHRHRVRQAENRHRQARRVQGQGCRAAHRRSGQHGQAAQGDGRAGRRQIHFGERNRSRDRRTARNSCVSKSASSPPVRRR